MTLFSDRRFVTSFVVCALVLGPMVWASEPDLEYNPATSNLESVDIAQEHGARVRHTIDTGLKRRSIFASAGAGMDARIAIDSDGDSWTAWWREGLQDDQIVFAIREPNGTSFSAETVISSVGEESRNPEIVHSGSETFVAYEVAGSTQTSLAVSITEDPEPFGVRAIIADTDYSGDVDVTIHPTSSGAYMTWVDSATEVGWSEYDASTQVWTLPEFESYASSSIAEARDAIADIVSGQ